MKLRRNDSSTAREPIVNLTGHGASELTEYNTVKTTESVKQVLEKLLCQE